MIRSKSIMLLAAGMLLHGAVNAQELNGKGKKSVKRLKEHIGYLASDELTGRATGTEGEKMSAEYIAEMFKKYKLEPKGENEYFQSFTITTLRIADASSKVTMGGEDLGLFTDYYPLSYSANQADVKGALADCGFGISSEERDDYKNVDVKGKIALINLSSPDGIHPHSKFLAWHGIKIRVDKAIEKGAIGVIFYRTNEDEVEKPDGALSLTMKPSSVPVLFLERMLSDPGVQKEASVKLNVLTDEDTGYNVIGYNDNKAATTIVIGAHHDHLGQGQHGNSLAENTSEIHNGADDNASGTAALFELAKALKRSKKWNKNNNYLFIAFSGEELGLLGSKYFVAHPTIDLKTVNYMINMDMVGMLNEEKALIINGVGTSPAFPKVIAELDKDKEGIGAITQGQSGVGPSDHTSFYLQGIPSVHYFTGAHEHYHKPSDDVENLNYEGEVYVIRYITQMIRDLNDDGRLAYTKTKDESGKGRSRSKFAVTLGVVPNYTFDGEGMQVDAVRGGKPGEKAGLQAKDVIVSFAGNHIGNMHDYMNALGGLKPGDKVEVGVMRDGKLITLEVQF